MDDNNLWFPPNTWKIVKALRFLNLLDDAENVLSPTKFNIWAANIGALTALGATIMSWLGHNMAGMETVWAGSIGWLTHAHLTHLADKKDRAMQITRTMQLKNQLQESKND